MILRTLRVTAFVSAVVLGAGGAYAQSAPAGEETPAAGAMSVASDLAAKAAHMSDPVAASTADHSKFDVLKGPFKSGPEVTSACLSCHTEASNQVMHSVHWKWEYQNESTGQTLGKAHEMNSFCGNVASNEMRCTSCHTGYDWADVRQPMPDDPTKVDCLVCHDTSGQYTKQDNLAGNPPLEPVAEKAKTITGKAAWAVDLVKAAQSVGPEPSRENCGNCHFYGGGGDNVKHGDLSSALFDPTPHVDVHMSKDGANMKCADCHVSDKHVFAGSRYETDVVDPHAGEYKPGQPREVASCTSCHTDAPHKGPNPVLGMKLNDHTDRVACQTCHIPEFAKGGVATKTVWDWSTAGKLKDGKPYSEDEFVQSDGKHLHTYMSTKGDFEWGEDVVPHYAWSNGVMTYTLPETQIDPTQTVELNQIGGGADDAKSRIFPFKRMIGKQAYDTERNVLAYNNVYGPGNGTALWSYFDWEKSLKAGMDYAGVEYSGKFDFVSTYMYWPITHMVGPEEEALKCDSCHAKDGRLANIAGIYMPGSGIGIGGKMGLVIFLLAALGVAGHGVLRFFGKKGAHHG